MGVVHGGYAATLLDSCMTCAVQSALKPGFAATTQVAEMSLDLSADLLVTDLAPIPALIQPPWPKRGQ